MISEDYIRQVTVIGEKRTDSEQYDIDISKDYTDSTRNELYKKPLSISSEILEEIDEVKELVYNLYSITLNRFYAILYATKTYDPEYYDIDELKIAFEKFELTDLSELFENVQKTEDTLSALDLKSKSPRQISTEQKDKLIISYLTENNKFMFMVDVQKLINYKDVSTAHRFVEGFIVRHPT